MVLMDEQILDRYHSNRSYSFGGKHHFHRRFPYLSKEEINELLSKSEIYTGFKEFKKPKKLPPIRVHGPNYLWEADLMFMTDPLFVPLNDGYLYILAVIDAFTKGVYIAPLKDKNTKTVTRLIEGWFKDEKPKYLRVDGGGEFISNQFTQMCQKYGVKLYIAQEPIKCAYIERFNRTFKRILMQQMEHNNSARWFDFLRNTIEIYSYRIHSSIGMSPSDAKYEEDRHDEIFSKNLKKYIIDDRETMMKNAKPAKFKKGQIVKVFKRKGKFDKGYDESTAKEYFEIYHIDRRLSKDRYYLKDLQGEKVIGSFYSEYLVPFDPPVDGEYRLDPMFKITEKKNIRRIPHIKVKWLGWPNKFNQWIRADSVSHLLTDEVRNRLNI